MRKTKLLSFLIVAVFIGSTFAIFLNTNMFLSKGSQLNNSVLQNSQTGQKIDQKLLSPESAGSRLGKRIGGIRVGLFG